MTKQLPVAFKEMQTDLTVSMDDVVSAFVSKYEVNLYERKKSLQSEIKKLERQLNDIEKFALRTVKPEKEWTQTIKLFNIHSTVSKGELFWAELKDNEDESDIRNKVRYEITIQTKGDTSGSYYRNSLSCTKFKTIPAALVNERKAVLKAIQPARESLTEVLNNIKSIARKERQVRGKIAIRKLEESGYANLMDDAELSQLVQLDG